MFEALKGLNVLDIKFIVPIIIGILVIILIVKIAKKLIKFALFIAVIALAVLIYFNLPSISIDGSVATLKVNGQEYRIDTRDVRLENTTHDGKTGVFLISDNDKTYIELPFSMDFAKSFILDKIDKAAKNVLDEPGSSQKTSQKTSQPSQS